MFRLYYDESGRVICYTCDALPGDNFIEIDRQTFAEGNPNLRIVDGVIRRDSDYFIVSKMVESTEGTKCDPDDICVISANKDSKKWKLETNEFRNY